MWISVDVEVHPQAHGNFVECTPMAVLCMLLMEIQKVPQSLVATAGAVFILGRLLHAQAFLHCRGADHFRWRILSTKITICWIIGAGLTLGGVSAYRLVKG